jgi:serine protease Do
VPRLPDWLIYLTIVAALLAATMGVRQAADAPPAPPPPPGAADMPLPATSPFAAARLVRVRRSAATGAAFSVSDSGVWLTSRRALCGGRPVLIIVAEGRGVAAQVKALDGDIAILTTPGGPPAAPLAPDARPATGDLGFVPGFLGDDPGEAAVRFLGSLPRYANRGGDETPRQAWAQVGRTEDSTGPISDLAGAPVLDGAGQVAGVVLGASPRRGRLYAASDQEIGQAMAAAKVRPSAANPIPTPATDNYGRVADALRRDLTVAQVACQPS